MLPVLFNIPDPLRSYQQFVRFNHLDIPDLKDEELRQELGSLRCLLHWLPPRHWIRDRVQELGKEYGRRCFTQNNQNPLRVHTPRKTEDFY